MIEVLIDDRVIKVNPKLTIDKYQKIQGNPIRYSKPEEILGLYLDISVDELRDLPVDQIKFVEVSLSNYILEPKTRDLVTTFELNGITYGLENDWQNMTWGQWVDLEVYSQSDKLTDNIHMLMALLYRPVTNEKGKDYKLEKFKSSKVMERADMFKNNLPIEMWFGVSTFFLQTLNAYITHIDNSLKAKMKIESYLKPLRKILPKWLLPKPLPDSTLNSLTNLRARTSQK
jgi:hypothetical protein